MDTIHKDESRWRVRWQVKPGSKDPKEPAAQLQVVRIKMQRVIKTVLGLPNQILVINKRNRADQRDRTKRQVQEQTNKRGICTEIL